MAKIKQIKTRLELKGRDDRSETIVYINYDNTENRSMYQEQKTDRFFIKLPQVVADTMGINEVRSKDQLSVYALFKETIEKFKHLKTETNRVILYRFESEPADRKNSWSSWSSGYKIVVWAGTFIEVVSISGNGECRYSYEKIDSPINYPSENLHSELPNSGEKAKMQVPWNETNEKFFAWVQVCMETLVNQLHGIKEPEALIDSINAGRLLPMGGTPEPTIQKAEF